MRAVHDLIIKDGTLVDGTGAEARRADVAVDAGRITEVGQIEGGATRIIDADGLLVTPGWVDVHTHYDGQVTWDSELAPTSWHGVTTLVMGNCGVGFAPAAPDRHDWLIGLMEGVEDIPGTALAEGIEWEWETFPEYLDALERRRWTVDVGTQVPHAAVRAYVMGERGARNEAANAEDIDAMRAIVLEALQAGALGFSTSRTLGHRAIDGELVPGTLRRRGRAVRHRIRPGRGRHRGLRAGPAGFGGRDARATSCTRSTGCAGSRPPSTGRCPTHCSRPTAIPSSGASSSRCPLDACAEGAQLFPQIAGRATGILTGHHTTLCLFSDFPAYVELRARCGSNAELAAALADPEVRRSIVSWTPSSPAQAEAMEKAYGRTFVLGDPPDYEPGPERSLAGQAAAAWRLPARGGLRRDGPRRRPGAPLPPHPQLRQRRPRPRARHDAAPPGPGRAGRRRGAHRDDLRRLHAHLHAHPLDTGPQPRRAAPARVRREEADTRHGPPLRAVGPRDHRARARGPTSTSSTTRVSRWAPRTWRPTCRPGGRRLLQKATGYVATIKGGTVTFDHGEATGELPGRLVRGAR